MKFTISVITFSALEHAKRCIASVMANSSDYTLILSANGNPQAARHFASLARENKHVEAISYPENLGFIIPSVEALKRAESEFFVLLNDDCTVSPGWLEALERPFKEFPTCALSAPVGGNFTKSCDPDKSVEYLFGWSLMGRTALLKEVGLFSDYLKFAYWEEIDLGFRLMARGNTLHVTPDCKVSHAGKATSSKIPGIKAIEQRNLMEVKKRFPQYFGIGKWK